MKKLIFIVFIAYSCIGDYVGTLIVRGHSLNPQIIIPACAGRLTHLTVYDLNHNILWSIHSIHFRGVYKYNISYGILPKGFDEYKKAKKLELFTPYVLSANTTSGPSYGQFYINKNGKVNVINLKLMSKDSKEFKKLLDNLNRLKINHKSSSNKTVITPFFAKG